MDALDRFVLREGPRFHQVLGESHAVRLVPMGTPSDGDALDHDLLSVLRS